MYWEIAEAEMTGGLSANNAQEAGGNSGWNSQKLVDFCLGKTIVVF
jgi:hypothetical protein